MSYYERPSDPSCSNATADRPIAYQRAPPSTTSQPQSAEMATQGCSTYRHRLHHAGRLAHVHGGRLAHEHHPGGLHGPHAGSLEHGVWVRSVEEWRVGECVGGRSRGSGAVERHTSFEDGCRSSKNAEPLSKCNRTISHLNSSSHARHHQNRSHCPRTNALDARITTATMSDEETETKPFKFVTGARRPARPSETAR